jgi:Na+/H+ antiporter NhaD/arsenite permease-like protein
MMPVETLPNASPITAFGLGLVSAVFDNIPLTTLALKQGGYNPAYLAYAVGFGGSITWFGSSAGVALAGFVHGHHHDGTVHKPFEKVKSLRLWLREGWHTPVAYVVGFVVLYLLVQW